LSKDFRLTEEEINKTILRSPYSLADSPAQSGLGAKQIKKYFYDFIRYFAQCLNLHLGDIAEITEALTVACQQQQLESSEHNASLSAHPHLRLQIEGAKSTANDAYNLARSIDLSPLATKEELEAASTVNGEVHEEIRALIELAKEKASSAYNLASGKSKVHPVVNIEGMYTLLKDGLEGINEGDVIVIAEPLVPEFIVYEKTSSQSGGDVFVDSGEAYTTEYEAGKIYYLHWLGVRVLALESGIDTSKLATKEELGTKISELLATLDEKTAPLATKEELEAQEAETDEKISALVTKDELTAHNESEEAHADIRELMQKKENLLLSRSSNRVYVKWSIGNMYGFLEEYYTKAGLLVDEYPVRAGDLIFVVENGLQVFRVSGVDPSATVISDLSAFLACEWENDTTYYIEPLGVYLSAIGSKLDIKELKKEPRLIQELTLKEDTVVKINTDSDGNAFSLEEVMVIIEYPAVTAATQIWMSHNDMLAVFTQSVSTGAPAMKIEGKYNGAYGDWFYNTIVCTSSRAQQMLYSYPLGHRNTNKLNKELSSITLALDSDLKKPLITGTKITVLGVDSK